MSDTQQLSQFADRCVKCGLCLQHCPTYLLTRDEGESPRGRIALIQGLVSGQLPYSERMQEHLGNCLKCRACERVCPSYVPYGELIDGALTYIERTQPHARVHHRLLNVLTDATRLHRLARMLRVYQRSGLRALARASGILKLAGLQRLENLLPPLPATEQWRDYYPAQTTSRGNVALFTGCIADAFDQPTTRAAIHVLTMLGYGVHVPRAQRCCGALHLHNEQPERAHELARENAHTFGALNVDAIISTASGCGATLREYDKLEKNLEPFARKVTDISTFLTTRDWPAGVKIAPLNQRIAVHDPCSLTNVLRQADTPYTLLRKIPGIELISLPDKARCCGAAGSHMLTHAQTADRLRDDKLANIEQLNVTTLASSNIGCALHLAAGLRTKKLDIEVIHPITLLARQIAT